MLDRRENILLAALPNHSSNKDGGKHDSNSDLQLLVSRNNVAERV